MAWLNLTLTRLARCQTCGGHARNARTVKQAHDKWHAIQRIATPDVLDQQRQARKEANDA